MKELPLSNSDAVALVDDDVYEAARSLTWRKTPTDYVATELCWPVGRHRKLMLHWFVMGRVAGTEWDHINRNPLDNRRANLRITTRQQNSMNRGKNKNNHTGYKGVCFDKSRGKYIAGVKVNYRRVNLGRYKTAEEAARAYDVAARAYHGEYAVLNFP